MYLLYIDSFVTGRSWVPQLYLADSCFLHSSRTPGDRCREMSTLLNVWPVEMLWSYNDYFSPVVIFSISILKMQIGKSFATMDFVHSFNQEYVECFTVLQYYRGCIRNKQPICRGCLINSAFHKCTQCKLLNEAIFYSEI